MHSLREQFQALTGELDRARWLKKWTPTMTQEEIAHEVGLCGSMVSKIMSVLKAPREVQNALENREINANAVHVWITQYGSQPNIIVECLLELRKSPRNGRPYTLQQAQKATQKVIERNARTRPHVLRMKAMPISHKEACETIDRAIAAGGPRGSRRNDLLAFKSLLKREVTADAFVARFTELGRRRGSS